MYEKNAILSITFNLDVLRSLISGPKNRQGVIAEIQLSESDRQDDFAFQALCFIGSIFETMGYRIQSQDFAFGQWCDCLVTWNDTDRVFIHHDKWSLAQVEYFRSVLEAFAKFYNWSYIETTLL